MHVAYLFGEFAKDYDFFLDVKFGEGDRIVDISYAWFDDDVEDVDFLFNDGKWFHGLFDFILFFFHCHVSL